MKNSAADPVLMLQALVRCASVTPREAGALSLVQSWLESVQFKSQRLTFQDENTPDVDNLFAWIGEGSPHFCFAGHTDVVPEGDVALWSALPFSGEIREGFLFGRGAVDMKGSIAAFAAAVQEFLREQPNFKGKISFLITNDEEGPAINGTAKVLRWMAEHNHKPDHCLVGEPSSLEQLGDCLKIGRRGSLSFVVEVEGRQGHAAYPHKADNPIPKLARLVEVLSAAKIDEGNEHFDPSTLAITSFDVGNPAGNVIPAKASLKFNIRFAPVHDYASLKKWVENHIEIIRAEMGGLWHMHTHEGAEAFLTSPGAFVELVKNAVQKQTSLVPDLSTSGGTSDARFIKDYCEVVEFGPRNATIHQTDERIEISELQKLTLIYKHILADYFR